MMSGSTRNRVLFSCPGNIRQEFRDDVPRFRLFNMFAKRPPAKVIGAFNILVGIVEKGYVFTQKIPRLGIGNFPPEKFVVVFVELVDVMLEILRIQNRRIIDRQFFFSSESGNPRSSPSWYAMPICSSPPRRPLYQSRHFFSSASYRTNGL